MEVRAGRASDLEGVAAIQAASPEAAQWDPRDYLAHDFLVAESGGAVAGFAAARRVAEGQSELLNLAVARQHRRSGIGRALMNALLLRHPGEIWLELRASNPSALQFYESIGFQRVGSRPGYYENPPETAIVMKFQSW
jgi:ribosomal-protein-alanine N-acetyltransferase